MTPQEIYQRYGSVVYRRARRLLGEDQAAKDACQEVFLRLFLALPEFDRASPVTCGPRPAEVRARSSLSPKKKQG